MLKAFDAAHQPRARPSGQDEYYRGNLPTDCRPERWKPSDPVTPELVWKTVAWRRVRPPCPADDLGGEHIAAILVLPGVFHVAVPTSLTFALQRHFARRVALNPSPINTAFRKNVE
jgi:hypothetical protein